MIAKNRLSKTEGIVLKRQNMGERDKLVTILTPYLGKMKVLAKGVRKVPSRRAGHLEVFTYGDFSLYQGKTFDHVQEVTGKTAFHKITSDLKKASYSYYLLELTDRLLPEKQEAYDVFTLLIRSLTAINDQNEEEEYAKEVYRFALDMLWFLGYLPRTQTIPYHKLQSHIEQIIERKLKTPRLIEKTG